MEVLKRFRKGWERRRKWLTFKGIWNVLLFSGAIIVIAAILELATSIVTSNLPLMDKTYNITFGWLALAVFLLVYAMLSPDLMDTVFQMLGFKQEEPRKEEKKDEDTSQNEM
jgi:hypothetical protein